MKGKVATKNSQSSSKKQQDKVQQKKAKYKSKPKFKSKCKMQKSKKNHTKGNWETTGRDWLQTGPGTCMGQTGADKYNDRTRSEGNTQTEYTDTDYQ